VLFIRVGTGFFPAADEGGFVLDYLTPAGSALAETDRQVRAIETGHREHAGGGVVFAAHGSELGCSPPRRTPATSSCASSRAAARPIVGRIISDVRERVHTRRRSSTIEFIQLCRTCSETLQGDAEPIEVKIFGDDPDRLAELASRRSDDASVDGVVDVVGVQRATPR
jgi:multidrug efflux pump subunit AcrB